MNLTNSITRLSVGTILLATLATHALAQSSTDSEAAKQPAAVNWVVNCSNQTKAAVLNCAMAQTLLQAKTRQRIASATIVKNLESLMMIISLPHGLDIRSGVQVSVDQGKAVSHQFQTADANGIYARFILDDELIANLKAGSDLKLKMTSGNKKAVELKMSLAGFSDSFNLMNR